MLEIQILNEESQRFKKNNCVIDYTNVVIVTREDLQDDLSLDCLVCKLISASLR